MKKDIDSVKRLIDVLGTQATSYEYEQTLNYIWDKCIEYGAEGYVDESDNMYFVKGDADAFPCVVSHTDTVHDIYPDFKIHEQDGTLFAMRGDKMEQVGTGGDDKVGVWVALEMLKRFDNIKVVFFAQEEIGCVGSSSLDLSFFTDVGYALQCDRQGNSDFVSESSGVIMFGNVFESKIKETITNRGYKITTGGLTDVHEVAQAVGVCCANMSCGYYSPHTDKETVVIDDAYNCMVMVRELIETLGEQKYTHEAVDTFNSWGGYGSYTHYGSSSKPSTKVITSENSSLCDVCFAVKKGTMSCDFCNGDPFYWQDDAGVSSVGLSEPSCKLACSCGGTYSKYGQSDMVYLHCTDCGHFKEVTN
tara:strand:- start:3859 stop:4944 length:1086 start_codon:yes stop_codon:yes gene_type:complete